MIKLSRIYPLFWLQSGLPNKRHISGISCTLLYWKNTEVGNNRFPMYGFCLLNPLNRPWFQIMENTIHGNFCFLRVSCFLPRTARRENWLPKCSIYETKSSFKLKSEALKLSFFFFFKSIRDINLYLLLDWITRSHLKILN